MTPTDAKLTRRTGPHRPLPVLPAGVLCKDCACMRSMKVTGDAMPDDDGWVRGGGDYTFAVCTSASRWKIDPVDGEEMLVKAVRCRHKNKDRDCADFVPKAEPPSPRRWWLLGLRW